MRTRKFTGEWAKAERWLVAHGSRQLLTSEVRRDGCNVRMAWGLVDVFGGPEVRYTCDRDVYVRYCRHVETRAREDALARLMGGSRG